MEKKNITKFPKGFFQLKRPTITASEALSDVTPIKWEKDTMKKEKQIVKLVKKK